MAIFFCLITVKSLPQLIPYIFSIPGVKVFLSERLCQDPLELFFGCQRQCGGTHENPTVQEFYIIIRTLRLYSHKFISVCVETERELSWVTRGTGCR